MCTLITEMLSNVACLINKFDIQCSHLFCATFVFLLLSPFLAVLVNDNMCLLLLKLKNIIALDDFLHTYCCPLVCLLTGLFTRL